MSKARSAKKKQQRIVRRPTKGMPIPLAAPKSRGALLRQAPEWPLHECLLSKNWQDPREIVQAIIARRSPDGQIAAAIFLIDLGCLGLKNGFTRLFPSQREYRELRREIEQRQKMTKANLDLVAKVIQEAVAYAQSLGFAPHPDTRRGMDFLSGADPAACDTPVPLGDGTGKPFFVAGPYDNTRAIMDKLMQTLGPDGFTYIVPLTGDEEFSFADEEE